MLDPNQYEHTVSVYKTALHMLAQHKQDVLIPSQQLSFKLKFENEVKDSSFRICSFSEYEYCNMNLLKQIKTKYISKGLLP